MVSAVSDLFSRNCKQVAQRFTQFGETGAGSAAAAELLDRTIFVVSPATYAKFPAMLDAPPKPDAALRRTTRARQWSKG